MIAKSKKQPTTSKGKKIFEISLISLAIVVGAYLAGFGVNWYLKRQEANKEKEFTETLEKSEQLSEANEFQQEADLWAAYRQNAPEEYQFRASLNQAIALINAGKSQDAIVILTEIEPQANLLTERYEVTLGIAQISEGLNDKVKALEYYKRALELRRQLPQDAVTEQDVFRLENIIKQLESS